MMLQETPLQLAMRAGESKIVEYLKQQRADTDSLFCFAIFGFQLFITLPENIFEDNQHAAMRSTLPSSSDAEYNATKKTAQEEDDYQFACRLQAEFIEEASGAQFREQSYATPSAPEADFKNKGDDSYQKKTKGDNCDKEENAASKVQNVHYNF
ncbi:unnamed protein product [Enterobius vermicularis]|uniref:ANK_REP_REGION domain-containing protein n=1 Tax=Enterobius vermicularis TaxID=51028 RepID=A0A0N4V6N6_ENTVE|nr:unnamed protein product [Enterobius vermicularis]